ncbi:hypothetical protein FRB99_002367 [Tulasnella sp. 403]|nr:hypothetical protein FRB99_002367 [Tulasnella sp. 403]
MPVNSVAENVFGTIGTILWMLQLVPQVWKSWRDHSTEGLSTWLMFIWAISAPFLGVYVIVENINIPLIVQPQLFTALASFSWIQCLYYGQKRSRRFCAVVYVLFLSGVAAFEAGVSHALKTHPNQGAIQFCGISSAVLISVGLIPQYIEIWKRKEVIGISMLFMAVDIGGGVFSILSLIFKPKFDVVAAVTYIAVIVMDGIIVIAAVILNPLARKRREREAEGRVGSPVLTDRQHAPRDSDVEGGWRTSDEKSQTTAKATNKTLPATSSKD